MSKRPRLVPGGAASAADAAPEDEDVMRIVPLGGGAEVGRSCHVLKFRGRTIMLDCGQHPARTGEDALPYLDDESVELGERERVRERMNKQRRG